MQQKLDTLQQGLRVTSIDEQVVKELKEAMEMNEAYVLERRQVAVLTYLHFSAMDRRSADIIQAHEWTFHWMFDSPPGPVNHPSKHTRNERLQTETREGFVAWLEDEWSEPGAAVYHILGKPGAGKSTLMKYLHGQRRVREHLQAWAGHKKLVLGSFFFWKPGSDIQKNLEGLIRGLLYRILREAPELIPIAFPVAWSNPDQWFLELSGAENYQVALKLLLQALHTCEEYRFALFLDGLDEFEDTHGTEFSLVSLILDWAKASQGNLKIVVSSRHKVAFEAGFNTSPGIRLQDLTRSDIEVVVKARLAEIQSQSGIEIMDDSYLCAVSTKILDRAQGVFLWVKLVLNIVEASMGQRDSPQVLDQKIDSLPVELKSLLQRIFDEIDAFDQQKACRTLQIVANSAEPKYRREPDFEFDPPLSMGCGLRLAAYSFWDNVTQDPDFVLKQPPTTESMARISRRLTRSRLQVYGVCKGLVDVVDNVKCPMESYLTIGHRSIHEYLQEPHVATLIRQHCTNFNAHYMRLQLFYACVKLIATPSKIRSAYEIIWMTHQFRRHREIYETTLAASETMPVSSRCRYLESLDHLLRSLESRQKFKVAFFVDNEDPDAPEECSDAVEILMGLAFHHMFPEHLSLHLERYTRLFQWCHDNKGARLSELMQCDAGDACLLSFHGSINCSVLKTRGLW